MNEILLYDKKGNFYKSVKIDRNEALPVVIIFEGKYFVWGNGCQHYKESTFYIIP